MNNNIKILVFIVKNINIIKNIQMIFENNFINYNNSLNINLITSYKNIRSKFIVKYVNLYEHKYINKQKLFTDALIYSKYYLYYKIQNCVYDDDIMEIIFNIENI